MKTNPQADSALAEAAKLIPQIAPGHWDTPFGQVVAAMQLTKGRGQLARGDLTDLDLANQIFLASREDLDMIVWQQAAKDRIRWLSAQLAAANQKVAEHDDRGTEIVLAYHAAICSPKGVVPDDTYYDATLAATIQQALDAGIPMRKLCGDAA